MLVISAFISRFSTLVDGSARVTVDLPELSPDQFREVGMVNKKHGVFVFKAGVESISDEEKKAIEEFDTSHIGDNKKKSKSQTLRAVLYRVFEQDNEGFKSAQEHYNHYMDVVTNHFKGKLSE